MPILFHGDCGNKLQADDALAGRMTRCPQCQAVLKILNPGAGGKKGTEAKRGPRRISGQQAIVQGLSCTFTRNKG